MLVSRKSLRQYIQKNSERALLGKKWVCIKQCLAKKKKGKVEASGNYYKAQQWEFHNMGFFSAAGLGEFQ